jgi:hypothetical protein
MHSMLRSQDSDATVAARLGVIQFALPIGPELYPDGNVILCRF